MLFELYYGGIKVAGSTDSFYYRALGDIPSYFEGGSRSLELFCIDKSLKTRAELDNLKTRPDVMVSTNLFISYEIITSDDDYDDSRIIGGWNVFNIYYKYTTDANKTKKYIERFVVYNRLETKEKNCTYANQGQFFESKNYVVLGNNRVIMNNQYILEKLTEEEAKKYAYR